MERLAPAFCRERLVGVAAAYMTGSLGLTAEFVDRSVSAARAGPWLEFAHTPQFPHLGIARMYLVAQREAARRDGIVVYCVNDHLAPRYLAESRYLPIHLAGKPVAAPPGLGLSKAQAKRGMHKLPPPAPASIELMARRLRELLPSSGPAVARVVDSLQQAASVASDLAAWFSRVWVDIMPDPVLVFPTSRFAAVFPGFERFEALGALHDYCWLECVQCGYRAGRTASTGQPCLKCGGAAMDTRPDVIGRQVISNQLAFAARICGAQKDYQAQADQISASLGIQPPPRIPVTGRTVVRQGGAESSRRNVFEPEIYALVNSRLWLDAVPADHAAPWLVSV